MLSETSQSNAEERIFNDDLLNNPGDLRYAEDQFPEILHLLDHEALRKAFDKYEKRANQARSWVRRLGLLAVLSATVALLSAATEPLRHHPAPKLLDHPESEAAHHESKFEDLAGIGFELCGILAALVAGGSVWLGPWRRRWLEARFMTERMRQWHFQLLVRKGAEIEPSLQQPEPFCALRKKWFGDFLHEYEGKVGSRMDSLIDDPDFSSDWLHLPATTFPRDSRAVIPVFEAYRRLRFLHQYDYATYQLSEASDRPFWEFLKWPLPRQERAIRAVVSFCFIAALLCSFGIIANRSFHLHADLDPYLGSATLVIAILGIAFRTVQDGLGITEDIERYRDYRGKVRRLLLEFEHSTEHEEKLRLMQEMELVVTDEMKGFLRTHRKAAFAL